MNDFKEFQECRKQSVTGLIKVQDEQNIVQELSSELFKSQYTYNFDWLGLPIIQYPQDILALQEIIWTTKPNIIIETGVARGGSIIFYASMLHLLNNGGKVIGIDIDIRSHNKEAIENHPLSAAVNLIEGSSIAPETLSKVKSVINKNDRVMVILDSNHTHDHVLQELGLYGELVTNGCYMVVLDTCVEDLPNELFDNRPWGHGNNPKTAVHEFVKTKDKFMIDKDIHNKLILSCAPDGYLRRIK